MSFKAFAHKTNPRIINNSSKPNKKDTREYLPNGFYVGQRVKYSSIFNEWQYGTVVEYPSERRSANNLNQVWAMWDNDGPFNTPYYTPRENVFAAE